MSSVSSRQDDRVSSLWIFYSSRWDGFYNGLKNDDLKYQTVTNVLYTGLIMKLNCTITQVQCSQKVINIITIIIKTKHHLLTNGVGQGDWWERDEDCETLLFVSFNACFVYGPTPVLLFVTKISFCDNAHVCGTKMMFFELPKGRDRYIFTRDNVPDQGICDSKSNPFTFWYFCQKMC